MGNSSFFHFMSMREVSQVQIAESSLNLSRLFGPFNVVIHTNAPAYLFFYSLICLTVTWRTWLVSNSNNPMQSPNQQQGHLLYVNLFSYSTFKTGIKACKGWLQLVIWKFLCVIFHFSERGSSARCQGYSAVFWHTLPQEYRNIKRRTEIKNSWRRIKKNKACLLYTSPSPRDA